MENVSEDFDVIVIGAGEAGLYAANEAVDKGLKVAIIEKNKWGGKSVHSGDLHARMFQKNAKFTNEIEKANEWGIEVRDCIYDLEKLRSRMFTFTMKETNRIYTELQKKGIQCFVGAAEIVNKETVIVNERRLVAKYIVIATGSIPQIPKIKGIENISYFTMDTIFNMSELPKSIVIVGGGVTAVEMAFCFAPLGVEVTIVEQREDILPDEDSEIRFQLKRSLAKLNVLMKTDATVQKITDEKIYIDNSEIEYERLFIACGKKANLDILESFELLCKDDKLNVDENFKTSVDTIYAVGDVCNANNFTKTPNNIHDEVYIRSLNTIPNVATFGLNEYEAEARNYEQIEVIKQPVQRSILGAVMNEGACILKLVIDREFEEVIGAIAIGEHANEVIGKIEMIVHLEGTLDEILLYVAT